MRTIITHKIRKLFSGEEDYIEKSSDCQKIDVLADERAFEESFANIRFSTAKPIPEETIQLLRIAGGNTKKLESEKYRVSLDQFLQDSQKTDLNVWEKLFCAISDEKPHTVGYASAAQGAYFISAIILATIVEVAGTVALRFPANVVVGFLAGLITMCLDISLLLRPANAKNLEEHKKKVEKFLDYADNGMHEKQNMLSSKYGLSGFRKQRDELQRQHYQTQFPGTKPTRTALLNLLTAEPKSSLASIAAEHASAFFVAHRVEQAYRSVALFFYMVWAGNPGYLGGKLRQALHRQSAEKMRKDLFEKLMLDVNARLQKHPDIDMMVMLL